MIEAKNCRSNVTITTTTRIGIMASHEQVGATDLLADVIAME
jgi:hypothetical protein